MVNIWNTNPPPTGRVPVPNITLVGNSYVFAKEFVKYRPDGKFLIPGSKCFEIEVDKIASFHRSLLHPQKVSQTQMSDDDKLKYMANVLYTSEITTDNAWSNTKKPIVNFDSLPYFIRHLYLEEAKRYL